jgi:hypothetical protein
LANGKASGLVTRKVAATRRRGKWSGGQPLLGYDIDPRGERVRSASTVPANDLAANGGLSS